MNPPPRFGRPLLAEEIAAFRKDGYVKLPAILSNEEVEVLRSAMASALETLATSPNGYDVTSTADVLWTPDASVESEASQHDLQLLAAAVRASGHPRLLDKAPGQTKRGRFLVDTSVWRRVDELAVFALDGPLPAFAAELLGVDEIRYYDDQLFVKEAGALDRAAFHQDISYFNLDGTCGCVAWIPLNIVRKGSGAMAYVSGSHLWGEVFNPNIFASRMAFPGCTGRDLPDVESAPDKFRVVYVDADPGDVIVHHFLTVHGSEGNVCENDRRAFSLRYCDSRIRYRRRPGAPAQPLHKADPRDGESLSEAFHPIAYVRTR
jgi:ectoine hydroxylase-related dioxygenase (phytanoyl-CoA dioxygenase family)